MADEILKRDQNSAVVLGGITDDTNQYIKMLRVDPATGRLLVSGSGGSISVSDGSTTVSNVTSVVFTGATVSSGGTGVANVVISSSGATVLSPTETPDGIRTTFTLSAATAQPTFIVSDNAQMRATTKSGTVNWTWNNGTKVVTVTIPPTEDIYGLA